MKNISYLPRVRSIIKESVGSQVFQRLSSRKHGEEDAKKDQNECSLLVPYSTLWMPIYVKRCCDFFASTQEPILFCMSTDLYMVFLIPG
jgi:hypothetical protein